MMIRSTFRNGIIPTYEEILMQSAASNDYTGAFRIKVNAWFLVCKLPPGIQGLGRHFARANQSHKKEDLTFKSTHDMDW